MTECPHCGRPVEFNSDSAQCVHCNKSIHEPGPSASTGDKSAHSAPMGTMQVGDLSDSPSSLETPTTLGADADFPGMDSSQPDASSLNSMQTMVPGDTAPTPDRSPAHGGFIGVPQPLSDESDTAGETPQTDSESTVELSADSMENSTPGPGQTLKPGHEGYESAFLDTMTQGEQTTDLPSDSSPLGNSGVGVPPSTVATLGATEQNFAAGMDDTSATQQLPGGGIGNAGQPTDIDQTLAAIPDASSDRPSVPGAKQAQSRSEYGGPPTFVGDLPTDSHDQTVQGKLPSLPNSGSDSANDVKKLWEGFADSRVGPMASIKSDEMSVGRQEGLVIHRRSLAPQDADKASESDYVVTQFLGQGAMGVVFEAKQTSMQRDVAVKTLRPELARRRTDRQKFLYEASITGDLDHPNIVPIHDVGANHDGTLFYSMKRVEGTPWQNVMHTKQRAENIETLLKVADAISFAHSRDVIHRDLKPENVMLGQFGEVLVMDWGLSVKLSKNEDFVLGGTPAYMAPEMARHQKDMIERWSDTYLLGAMLFQIITGLPPHPGETVTQCVAAAARNEIVAFTQNDELMSIALKAMDTNPRARYASVADFQKAIRDYQEHAESVQLAQRAEQDLEQGIANNDNQAFSRARFGFEDAIKLWPENKRAVDGYKRARIAHATEALTSQNFELGMSLLDPNDVDENSLFEQLRQGAADRESREKRLKAAKKSATMFLLIAVGLAAAGLAYVFYTNDELRDTLAEVREEKKRADLATEEAREATKEAREKEKVAKDAETEALRQEEIANDAALQATQAQGRAEAAREESEARLRDNLNLTAEARRDQLAAGQLTVNATDSQWRTILGQQDLREEVLISQIEKYRASLAVAKNDFKDGKLQRATDSIDAIREDHDVPLSYKDWDLYRIRYVSTSGLSKPALQLESPIVDVDSSATGDLSVVATSTEVFIYDGEPSSESLRVQVEIPQIYGPIRCLELSPSGRELWLGTDRDDGDNLLHYRYDAEQLALSLVNATVGHGRKVYDIKLSDDELTLATSGAGSGNSGDASLFVRDREQPGTAFGDGSRFRDQLNYKIATTVDLSPDKSRLLIVTRLTKGGPRVAMVYELGTGQGSEATEAPGDRFRFILSYRPGEAEEAASISTARFDVSSPQGRRIIAGAEDGTVLSWDTSFWDEQQNDYAGLEVDSEKKQVFFPTTYATILTGHQIQPIRSIVSAETNAEDGSDIKKQLLVTGGDGPNMILWDAAARQPRYTLQVEDTEESRRSSYNCATFLSNQQTLLAARGRTLQTWSISDIETDKLFFSQDVATQQPTSSETYIPTFDFIGESEDPNKWIVGGDRSGNLSIWSTESSVPLVTRRHGHLPDAEARIHASATTDVVVTSSEEGRVTVWNRPTGDEQADWIAIAEWNNLVNPFSYSLSNNGHWLLMAVAIEDGETALRLVDLTQLDNTGAAITDFPLSAVTLSNDDLTDDRNLVSQASYWQAKIAGISVSEDAQCFALVAEDEYCYLTRGTDGLIAGPYDDITRTHAHCEPLDDGKFLTITENRLTLLGDSLVRHLDFGAPQSELFGGESYSLRGLQFGELRSVDDQFHTIVYSTLKPGIRAPNRNRDASDADKAFSVVYRVRIGDWLSDARFNQPGSIVAREHSTAIVVEGSVVDATLDVDGQSVIVLLSDGTLAEVGTDSGEQLATTLAGANMAIEQFEQLAGMTQESLPMARMSMSDSGVFHATAGGMATIVHPDDAVVFSLMPSLEFRAIRAMPIEGAAEKRHIAAIHGDGTLRIWEWTPPRSNLDGAGAGDDSTLSVVHETAGDFYDVKVSPDGMRLLLVEKTDGGINSQVSVLEFAPEFNSLTPLELDSIDATKNYSAVTWSNLDSDGNSFLVFGAADGTITMVRCRGNEFDEIPLPDNVLSISNMISSVAVSPNHDYVAIGTVSGECQIITDPFLDRQTRRALDVSLERLSDELRESNEDANEEIANLEFSPTGNRLLISQDRSISLWHIDSSQNELITDMLAESYLNPILNARFTPDGESVVTSSLAENWIRLLKADSATWDADRKTWLALRAGDDESQPRTIDEIRGDARDEIQRARDALVDAENKKLQAIDNWLEFEWSYSMKKAFWPLREESESNEEAPALPSEVGATESATLETLDTSSSE